MTIRSPSLRLRVAASAAAGALLIVVIVGVIAAAWISHNESSQLDVRVDTLALSLAERGKVPASAQRADPALAVTIRDRAGSVLDTGTVLLPHHGQGFSTATVDGERFRVHTLPIKGHGGELLSVGLPEAPAQSRAAGARWEVLFIGIGAVVLAGGLGWLIGGRALRPLRLLTDRTRKIHWDTARPVRSVEAGGSRETEELAGAITGLLERIQQAQGRTEHALGTARDFAASAAHELRTPLTVMRTDLEVLRAHELSDEDRIEVLDELARTQARVEGIVTALGQLAAGELAGESDFADVDVRELFGRAADDASRLYPQLVVTVLPGVAASADLPAVRAWPAGLRLAVDNLIKNAVVHGRARRVELGADLRGPAVLSVDDDGRGLPPVEYDQVLQRFQRGSTAAPGGSGLGLALVVQQAALHGGGVRLSPSRLGGLRVELWLWAR
ncbi:sensor histidine kinase [Speluncibacter jeojiensis]|uniref:sensor histidine kinase n=1 Tax=Speluncibacter jeojiensis TaxID=2710754 RepID=UPI0024107BA9|nr:HAMP domain-containing sensor histidine kinase [Rhodococcus sp. D2-41]